MPDPSHRGREGGGSRVAVAGLAAVCLLAAVIAGAVFAESRESSPSTATTDRALSSVRSLTADRKLSKRSVKRVKRAVLKERRSADVMRFDYAPKPFRIVYTPQQMAARKAARQAKWAEIRARRERKKLQGAPFDMVIGTFNVLGSQHTAPGGERRNFPPASVRNGQAAGYISGHGVDILGTQELQADQLRALQSMTGMSAYPGFGWGEVETDNSILWDPAKFELLSGDSYSIVFVGRARPQPIVKLKHKLTGQQFYVINTHPSPGGGRALTERRNAQATTVALVNRLKSEGIPVFITGDMNDRQEFYCQVVGPAGMTTPQGGSYGGGCRPPTGHLAVDWVAGTDVSWSNYRLDTSPVARRTSDHFFISATAHVD